eukprot:664826-Prymnesium_polylepis.1
MSGVRPASCRASTGGAPSSRKESSLPRRSGRIDSMWMESANACIRSESRSSAPTSRPSAVRTSANSSCASASSGEASSAPMEPTAWRSISTLAGGS